MKAFFITFLFLFMVWGNVSVEAAPKTKAVELIECGDRRLAFKILCNPKWPVTRDENFLRMEIGAGTAKAYVTVSQSEESGIDHTDLNASALQRVYHYVDGFKYAKTKVHWRKAVRIEGQWKSVPNIHLLDYFVIRDKRLIRVSYSAWSKKTYYKYLPVFAAMMRSFDFIEEEATDPF